MSGDFTERNEPFALFAAWFEEATASEPNDPNAMALSTVDAEGLPDVRMVLLKGFDAEGFVFYTNTESDAYVASRPRDSRIGAWASRQSRPLESRFALEKAVAAHAAKYAVGEIPRPPYWTGFRIRPVYIEFWQDKPFRLHDRIVFRRPAPTGTWTKERLYP